MSGRCMMIEAAMIVTLYVYGQAGMLELMFASGERQGIAGQGSRDNVLWFVGGGLR